MSRHTKSNTTPPNTLEKLTATEERRLKQNERLISVLQEVEEKIERQNSLKLVFVRGALYGLGTVIGATVLIAILGWFLANTIGSLDNLPIIGHLISEEIVREVEQAR
jgi:hypothetical protein